MYNHIKEIGENGVAEIYIFSTINAEIAQNFIGEFLYLESLESVNTINVSIISSGGSVIDGQRIFSTIIDSKKYVQTFIKGIVASISSLIALAGDKVYMYDYATIMWHNTHMGSDRIEGLSEKERNALTALDESLNTFYKNRTSLTPEMIKSFMDEETWFSPAKALEYNLIDEIVETGKRAEKNMENSFLEEIYNNHIDLINDEFNEEFNDEVKSSFENVDTIVEIENKNIADNKMEVDYKNMIDEITNAKLELENVNNSLVVKLNKIEQDKADLEKALNVYVEKEKAEKLNTVERIVNENIENGKINGALKSIYIEYATNNLDSFVEKMNSISVKEQDKLSDLINGRTEKVIKNISVDPFDSVRKRK